MFIGKQPTRETRKRSQGNVAQVKKASKRKANDITEEVALTVTTISKRDTSNITAPDATMVSACLRWKILCC